MSYSWRILIGNESIDITIDKPDRIDSVNANPSTILLLISYSCITIFYMKETTNRRQHP